MGEGNAKRAGYRATGPLRCGAGRGALCHVGSRQVGVMLTVLALNAGRVV